MNNFAAVIYKSAIFSKNGIWTMIGLFSALILGISIAYENWIYIGAMLVPLVIYCCIEKPFIFPFGAYVLLIPFDSILSVTGSGAGTTVTKLLGIMTIAVLSLKGICEHKFTKPGSVIIWLLLLISYGLLSGLWAIEPELALNLFPTAVGLLLLYFIVSLYQIEKNEFEMLKWCTLSGGFLASLYATYKYFQNNLYAFSERASMIAGERAEDPNYFAYTLIIPISVCIHMMLKQNRVFSRILLGIALSVMIFSVIITGSRGGFIGVLLVMFAYVLLSKKRMNLIFIGIAILIVLLQFTPEFFIERLRDAVETKGIGRTHILYVGWKASEKYWLVGAGLNNFIKAFTEFAAYDPNFQDFDRGAHNLYLGTFLELGIIGITLLMLTLIKHYRLFNVRSASDSGDAIMLKAAFWGILATSFFLDPMFRKSFWLLWMMFLMHKNSLNTPDVS